eukprot:3479629-Amphidinium_carterae.1
MRSEWLTGWLLQVAVSSTSLRVALVHLHRQQMPSLAAQEGTPTTSVSIFQSPLLGGIKTPT